ncbi:hypothetical protein ACFSC4_12355 [Deinococcus malanensis]|uniref:hypothetical protein n=1 Tax=Deinococcus malanensis TaxID=1706855 RepID=UPI003625D8E5
MSVFDYQEAPVGKTIGSAQVLACLAPVSGPGWKVASGRLLRTTHDNVRTMVATWNTQSKENAYAALIEATGTCVLKRQ